mmetsp:Transcript_160660/g.283289  ORF Transcript_160660/g.283289 Transcript_160660/m.283289 type:complete len:731 (+) Transcript_160660:64-2256(+)
MAVVVGHNPYQELHAPAAGTHPLLWQKRPRPSKKWWDDKGFHQSHPSRKEYFITTATGGLLKDIVAREREHQRLMSTVWREVHPAETAMGIQSRPCFGEKVAKAASTAPSWAGSFGGTVEMDLGADGVEHVDIDKIRGPKVLCEDGTTEFMMESDTTWMQVSAPDQKFMVRRAAQRNRRMRPKVAAFKQRMEDEEESKVFLALSEQERKQQRCDAEQAKTPAVWKTITMDMVMKNHAKKAKGILYGIEFAWNEQTLDEMGPEWLTNAMHTAGTLEKSNSVTELIVNEKVKIDGGNNAGKFLFEVRYKNPRKDLHEKLFVKCPYKMNKETQSDRISSSVLKQPMDLIEINVYRLMEANFPFKTPKFYFGDISCETSNYILITDCIPYTGYTGVAKDAKLEPYEVEGPYDKCKDWQLRGGAKDYYLLLMKAHGMVAGYDKAGTLCSDKVKKTGLWSSANTKPDDFGAKPEACSGEDPQVAANKLDVAIDFFADKAKSIFPEFVQTDAFKKKFKDTMLKWNAYRAEIVYWKTAFDSDYAALGHANLNADNAYYWRTETGELECGIIDFGGFGYSANAHKIWWTFNCADYDNFKNYLDEYLETFIKAYHEYGGPLLEKEPLRMGFLLTCLENCYFMVSAIPNCYKMVPMEVWYNIEDRDDPRISSNVDGKSTLRTTHHVLNNCLQCIEEMKADEMLDTFIEDIYVKKMGFKAKTEAMYSIGGAGGSAGALAFAK